MRMILSRMARPHDRRNPRPRPHDRRPRPSPRTKFARHVEEETDEQRDDQDENEHDDDQQDDTDEHARLAVTLESVEF